MLLHGQNSFTKGFNDQKIFAPASFVGRGLIQSALFLVSHQHFVSHLLHASTHRPSTIQIMDSLNQVYLIFFQLEYTNHLQTMSVY